MGTQCMTIQKKPLKISKTVKLHAGGKGRKRERRRKWARGRGEGGELIKDIWSLPGVVHSQCFIVPLGVLLAMKTFEVE